MRTLVKEMDDIEGVAKILFFNPEKAQELVTLDRVSGVVKEIGEKIQDHKNQLRGTVIDKENLDRISAIFEAIAYLENLRKILIG